MQMAKNTDQNTTDCKLDIGHIPHSSDSESLFGLWLACSDVMKRASNKKAWYFCCHKHKKTKPIQDFFQKPLYADNDSTYNYKSVESELEIVSSSTSSFPASKVYLSEELHQDMQRFKNEIGMSQVEFLALEKEKVQLPKEIEVPLAVTLVFSF